MDWRTWPLVGLLRRRTASSELDARGLRAWPVLVALGVVTLLLLAMLGVDLVVARRVAWRTNEIVGNTQRSIELVDDLRALSTELASPAISDAERNRLSARILNDVQAYDPLATSRGEREEFDRLRATLDQL